MQFIDVSLIILSCLQNSHKSHESIIRGSGRGGGGGGKPETFCQKIGNSIKCVISNKSKF